ncbi:hypothetical protein V1477_005355 [Vespula maculifrons]|uniref:Uncharacterized protein n=1 Tax=Vespula maculifrons TaxID=7453 RepID=A0ABD2CPF4_VESMC
MRRPAFYDIDLCLMARAIETISSNDKFPLCLIFFCLFLSLGGSLSALITKEAADGTTEITLPIAGSFSNIITNFFRGPIFGARDEVAPTSPPTHLKYTIKNYTSLNYLFIP